MPVIFQRMIYTEDLDANLDNARYLFGDNDQRAGKGGQAAAMRGHAAAIGVRTKHHPSMTDPAFWSDDHLDENMVKIDEDLRPAFEWVRRGGVVVIPSAGLGTDRAKMPERCPKTFAYLEKQLFKLFMMGLRTE